MSDPSKLDRATLAKFLPTHEAVKAFEKLFEQVIVTTPGAVAEIEEFSQIPQRSSQSEFFRTELENIVTILELNDNNQRRLISQLESRIQVLEQMIGI